MEAEAAIRALLADWASASKSAPYGVGERYEVELVTAQGTLVDRLLVFPLDGDCYLDVTLPGKER